MMTQLDRELRDALADLASAPPPSGLAGRAVRHALRRRRVVRAASALACLALVATASVVLSSDPDGHGPAPAPSLDIQAPPRTQRQSVITALSYTNGSNVVLSIVLNRYTDRYEDVPYRTALPSADSAHIVVVEGTDPTLPPQRLGVLTVATGHVDWIPGSAGYYPVDWSPDGRRVVLSHSTEGGRRVDFAILDATDPTRAPEPRTADVDPLWMAWGPDGESLLIPQIEADRIRAIVRVGLDGRRQSSIPVDAPIVPPGLLVTADGTRALVATASNRGIVVDTVTGATTQVPLAGRPLAWVGNHWLLANVGDGIERSTHSLSLIDLTGAVTQRVRVPVQPELIYGVQVGSSAGLGPMTRHMAF